MAAQENFFVAESGGIEDEWVVVMKDRARIRAQEGEDGTYSEKALRRFARRMGRRFGSDDFEIISIFNSILPGFIVGGVTEEGAREIADNRRVAFVEQNSEFGLGDDDDAFVLDGN